MARKIVNTTHSANYYDILSQTPKNYDKSNYFIKELQEKVDAEWEYRPNRVDIEYENQWGEQTYAPIEVVIQTARSEKGEIISDDYRNIVFRNISESRFKVGNRFRIPADFRDSSNSSKNIWIAINKNSVKMTSSMIIERCNGVLGSMVKDAQGISRCHYEPVIQSKNLSSTRAVMNDVITLSQSQLLIIAQHNDYTRDYFINQRFIIGYDQVYRIQAINKFYSNSTFNAEDVGLMYIYLELTEKSPYDDFEHRIAYQNVDPVILETNSADNHYRINFIEPSVIPNALQSTPIAFEAQLLNNEQVVPNVEIKVKYEFANEQFTDDIDQYISYQSSLNKNRCILSRKQICFRSDLIVTWYIPKGTLSSEQEEISASLKFKLNIPG